MEFKNAKYLKNTLDENGLKTIEAVIDKQEEETLHIPLDPANSHYAEILKQVKEGTLTIKDAE